MQPHYFSLQEANAALELIGPLMDEVQTIQNRVLASRPDLWPALERSAGNGGNAELSRLVKDFERLDSLVHRILATGAELKDLSTGLLDFRALRNGQEVYLCWKYGEDQIRFWHEIDAGFAGRQPIEQY